VYVRLSPDSVDGLMEDSLVIWYDTYSINVSNEIMRHERKRMDNRWVEHTFVLRRGVCERCKIPEHNAQVGVLPLDLLPPTVCVRFHHVYEEKRKMWEMKYFELRWDIGDIDHKTVVQCSFPSFRDLSRYDRESRTWQWCYGQGYSTSI